MRKYFRCQSFAAVAALCGVGCSDSTPPAITVGPVSFSEVDVLGLSAERRLTLAQLAAFGLAVSDSTTAELGEPLVSSWADDRLLEVLAAELTLEKNEVEDEVLEAQYLSNPQWELSVRHILFFSERWRSESHRAEAAAKAARAMGLLRNGADFASTASELSEEPGAEGRQGLLTPGREGSWVPEFWQAALALEPGQISPVTETQYGYHILRLEDRRVIPFLEARAVVARSVANRIEDPTAVLQSWEASVMSDEQGRRAVALAEARRRNLEVPASERAELLREWDDRVYRWSATLGFERGLAPQQVAEAAMRALSNPAQGAGLVRTELAEHANLLSAQYPILIVGTGR